MTTDLTPEHTARHPDSDSYSEVIAAYQYVQSVIPTADVQSSAGGYAWHGWALREAFLAGCTHARAALADEPAVPEGREPASITGQPSDEELALIYHDCCRGCEFMDQGGFENAARAVLARWGSCQGILDSSAPAPAGEVVELVAWLREQADHELGSTFDADYFSEDPAARNLNRAADLLQHLSPPQPVPVSERLPGPGEMTEDGEVWVDDPGHDYPIADSGDYDWEPHKWIMRPISRFDAKYGRRWLPAHALPVPGQGVEG